MTLRAAVFASGRGSNFAALTEYAAARGQDARWSVALLVTNHADAPVLERAGELGVEGAVVVADGDQDAYGKRLLSVLHEAEIDVVLLAGFLRLLPPAVVARYRGRILNIHPALLPSFGGKGMYGHHVHDAVISSGACISGATVHIVDEEYDRGPIVAQWPVPVSSEDTAQSLAARINQVEHRLYPAAVDRLVEGLCDAGGPGGTQGDFGRMPGDLGKHFELSEGPDGVGKPPGSSRP